MPQNYEPLVTDSTRRTTGLVQTIAATSSLYLLGFSCQESTGAAAALIIRHGTTGTDTPLAYVKLAANESLSRWFGLPGLPASSGLLIHRTTGTTEICLWTTTIG